MRPRGVDREVRPVGLDRVLEQHVEHRLFPIELRVVGQRIVSYVRQSVRVAGKGGIGRQRDPRGDDVGFSERRIVLVKLDVVRNPHGRRVAKHRLSG